MSPYYDACFGSCLRAANRVRRRLVGIGARRGVPGPRPGTADCRVRLRGRAASPADNTRTPSRLPLHFLKKNRPRREAYGPESIFQAITDCTPTESGTHMAFAHTYQDRHHRSRGLPPPSAETSKASGSLEVCLTSNSQTHPRMRNLLSHPCVKCSIPSCPSRSAPTTAGVAPTVTTNCCKAPPPEMTPGKLRNVVWLGFQRQFLPAPTAEKRHFVRQVSIATRH